MDWPARSPDLNPIEHVWDFLGRRLTARTLPPVTIRELRLALQDEWASMPQQLIATLLPFRKLRVQNFDQYSCLAGLKRCCMEFLTFWKIPPSRLSLGGTEWKVSGKQILLGVVIYDIFPEVLERTRIQTKNRSTC
ncbi:hypothetical protein TNCV_3175761 [Trichonephila clavipes]|nr:hypothetical protein TNCV_3175761 [Trichonephila clavipes]